MILRIKLDVPMFYSLDYVKGVTRDAVDLPICREPCLPDPDVNAIAKCPELSPRCCNY
jgi:hypothetical protein